MHGPIGRSTAPQRQKTACQMAPSSGVLGRPGSMPAPHHRRRVFDVACSESERERERERDESRRQRERERARERARDILPASRSPSKNPARRVRRLSQDRSIPFEDPYSFRCFWVLLPHSGFVLCRNCRSLRTRAHKPGRPGQSADSAPYNLCREPCSLFMFLDFRERLPI